MATTAACLPRGSMASTCRVNCYGASSSSSQCVQSGQSIQSTMAERRVLSLQQRHCMETPKAFLKDHVSVGTLCARLDMSTISVDHTLISGVPARCVSQLCQSAADITRGRHQRRRNVNSRREEGRDDERLRDTTLAVRRMPLPSLGGGDESGLVSESPHGVMTRVRSSAAMVVNETASLGDTTHTDFPILNQEINGQRIVYLDNAATSQKPRAVLDAVRRYYEEDNSNVHRGIHTLSVRATEAYEEARAKIARFVNARSESEIIYTRNATEAINLVANTWGLAYLKPGDEVVLSVMEHHSNLVPWQIVAQKTGAVLRFVGLSENESLNMEELKEIVGAKTKLVALQHVSNALGCVNDAHEIASIAHKHGAKVLLDACQSLPHMPVDVRALDCDWLVGSGHKMCGPTGIGFLYGKFELLKSMPPFLGGGEMIQDVFLDHSTYAEPPNRFEAGTPAIGEAIGLGAACDYLSKIGMAKIHDYEVELSEYLYRRMSEIEGLRIYGPKPSDPRGRAALCSFNVEGVHPTDLSTILDQSGFAVRSGHHCAQPLHRHFGISASARASLYFYNTKEEIDLFIDGLREAIQFFTFVPKEPIVS